VERTGRQSNGRTNDKEGEGDEIGRGGRKSGRRGTDEEEGAFK
jgi:hypothetical protein